MLDKTPPINSEDIPNIVRTEVERISQIAATECDGQLTLVEYTLPDEPSQHAHATIMASQACDGCTNLPLLTNIGFPALLRRTTGIDWKINMISGESINTCNTN